MNSDHTALVRRLRAGAIVIMTLVGSLACSGGEGKSTDGPTDGAAGGSYVISMQLGHTHIYKPSDVTFTVRDMSQCVPGTGGGQDCPGVPGLALVAFHSANGVRQEQPLE